ncbi:MAG: UvrD-helicase domain-containing protein [Acidimicrobiales bacterium]
MGSTPRSAPSPSPAQPLAILAGAGSGKTRVLTRRIAHRCLTGSADPRHVLAITFTRKAAEELDARLRASRIARPAGGRHVPRQWPMRSCAPAGRPRAPPR